MSIRLFILQFFTKSLPFFICVLKILGLKYSVVVFITTYEVFQLLEGVHIMNKKNQYTLGIDIGSTTVKIAILDEDNEILFSDYERHFANIQETL